MASGVQPGGLDGHWQLLCLSLRHHSHTCDRPPAQTSEQPDGSRFQFQQMVRPDASTLNLPSGSFTLPLLLFQVNTESELTEKEKGVSQM